MVHRTSVFAFQGPGALTVQEEHQHCGAYQRERHLIKIIASRLQWSERQLEHQNLLANYQLIAQKARRLDNTDGLSLNEIGHLCRHLEETFEIYKTTGIEPDDVVFKKAQDHALADIG
jgi:hypothetical protein